MADNVARQIVIVGGGFGGVYTAIQLEKMLAGRTDIQATLISRDNFFLMTPLLFEAGSGVLEPRHAVHPIRPLLKRVRFIEAEVHSIDCDARTLCCRHAERSPEKEIHFDQLVVALGGVTNTKIIPGSEMAMPFKTLGDGIALRNHVIDRFEAADVEPDLRKRRELMTFVVVGAGLVGVELMGELSHFIKSVARSYPNLRDMPRSLVLLENGPKVLPEMDRDIADFAVKVFKRRQIDVRVSSPVEKVEPHRVHIRGGQTIEAGTILLAAGVAPNPLLEPMNLEKSRGRLQTDATMRCIGRDHIWAIGDCALIPDPDGKPYPQLAQHALRQARLLGPNIIAAMDGREPKPFIYHTQGTLAALGHYNGVGRIMKLNVYGFVAWWIWRTYYLMQMPRWERRIRIVSDWTLALFFRNDVVKLDVLQQPPASRADAPDTPPADVPPQGDAPAQT